MIDVEARAALKQLVEKATAAPIDMLAVMENMKTADGRRDHFARMKTLTIPILTHFFVTFSIENGHPVGMCRHMSMSIGLPMKKGLEKEEGLIVPGPNNTWLPSVSIICLVCQELGFTGTHLKAGERLKDCNTWLEDIGDYKAVNVVQPIQDEI